MATAIAVYDSDGCVGRCDARCHNATSPSCDCICGGRLHGVGSHAIEQNTRDLLGDELAERLKELATARGLGAEGLQLVYSGVQLEIDLVNAGAQ